MNRTNSLFVFAKGRILLLGVTLLKERHPIFDFQCRILVSPSLQIQSFPSFIRFLHSITKVLIYRTDPSDGNQRGDACQLNT
jgi:hypothetical protein